MKCPVPCLECGTYTMVLDLNEDHQHIACERCERVWCARCIGRWEITISEEWLKQQKVASLN